MIVGRGSPWVIPPDFTVVRLKGDPGQCDYRCARSLIYRSTEPFWHFQSPKWETYYRQYSKNKPSTGLCAVFCAIDELNPRSIYLAGFDSVLDAKELRGHDTAAENKCLYSLGVEIIDVRGYGSLP